MKWGKTMKEILLYLWGINSCGRRIEETLGVFFVDIKRNINTRNYRSTKNSLKRLIERKAIKFDNENKRYKITTLGTYIAWLLDENITMKELKKASKLEKALDGHKMTISSLYESVKDIL